MVVNTALDGFINNRYYIVIPHLMRNLLFKLWIPVCAGMTNFIQLSHYDYQPHRDFLMQLKQNYA